MNVQLHIHIHKDIKNIIYRYVHRYNTNRLLKEYGLKFMFMWRDSNIKIKGKYFFYNYRDLSEGNQYRNMMLIVHHPENGCLYNLKFPVSYVYSSGKNSIEGYK
jgi:hypothetical protein